MISKLIKYTYIKHMLRTVEYEYTRIISDMLTHAQYSITNIVKPRLYNCIESTRKTMEYYQFRISEHLNRQSNWNSIERNEEAFDVNNYADRQNALQLLKNEIGACMDLALSDKSCCDDDAFLSQFLFVTNFKVEDSLNRLINYLKYKKENMVWLKDINIFDEKIQMALKDGNPRVLKQRDRKGRKIITFVAANWDAQKYNLIDLYRAFLISVDKLLENIQNQALGFVVIVDWSNVNINQTMHLTPKVLKFMVNGLQDCIPANFMAIHFISHPWYIDIITTVLKSLLSPKMKNRFYVHGSNLAALHDYINKDVLPPDLGGEGPITTTLDWYHFLLESSQTIEVNKTYSLVCTPQYTKIS